AKGWPPFTEHAPTTAPYPPAHEAPHAVRPLLTGAGLLPPAFFLASVWAPRRLAQTVVLWGLRFPEGACGSPGPATKSRGPTEQVRATIARPSRLVEQHAAGCQVPGVRYQVSGAGAGAGCYEKLSTFRFLPTADYPKATVCASPRKAVSSKQKAAGSWQDAADSRQLTA